MSFVFVIAIAWGLRILLNILSYIYLWYLKEYRFDRMLIHLKSPQGKNIFFLPWRRPPVRLKTIALFIGTLFVLWIIPGPIILRLLLADLLSFPVVSVLVFITKIPTLIYHSILIRIAVSRLRSHKLMTVIGITGSYGKTTTKEILFTLLNSKYKTLATTASKNSPIAIAELVLSAMRPDHEVFIVEMGAYKKGEIAQMCRIVRPEIGIVTAVNAQHQDLFGSIEHTIEAKYELLCGLSGRRIAIVNSDNSYVKKMGDNAALRGCMVIPYSTKGIAVSQNSKGLQVGRIFIELFGVHQASNVMAASEAAKAAGMSDKEIRHAAKFIKPLPHTMNPVQGINGSVFIDDTFNNNPDAAIAALDFLATRAGKKFLVFQPMIELGEFARESHERVAKHAAGICDEIILTNNSFADLFSGTVMSPKEAALHIKNTVHKGDTVLFKGKEAGRVIQLLV